MKGLFCYDGPLQADELGNYYGTVINDKVFSRYRPICDELKVAIRVEKAESPDEKSLIRSGFVSICGVDNLSSLSGQLGKRKTLSGLRRLVEEADFLIIRLPSFIGNECEQIARRLGKPYLIEMVGCPWDSLWNFGLKGKVLAPWMYLSTRSKVRKSRFTIYVTNEFLQHRYPTKGSSASCSNVELPNELSVDEDKISRYRRLSRDQQLVLGTSAAVNVPYKGQDCVIRAVGELAKMGFDVRYELAGGGSQDRLNGLAERLGISERVTFKGLLPHEEIFSWLKHVDVYIQPSKQEGLPRALIEAMSATCFCLGTRTGGIPELLPDRFIVSNGASNHVEIAQMIVSNFSSMADGAIANFEAARRYEHEKIQRTRERFLLEFENCVMQKKNVQIDSGL